MYLCAVSLGTLFPNDSIFPSFPRPVRTRLLRCGAICYDLGGFPLREQRVPSRPNGRSSVSRALLVLQVSQLFIKRLMRVIRVGVCVCVCGMGWDGISVLTL